MSRIISLHSFRGGTGKSNTTANIAALLAAEGHCVGVVDTDIQSPGHGTGAAGAPKIGDKGNWAPRIKQGMAVLKDHAIKGYQGKAGMMPAKGGRADIPDADVGAAVEYMVSQSK